MIDDGAVISEDGRYRYELTRGWDEGKLVAWVLLNPSTADATTDDPTIRRCRRYANRWGYGGMVILNLFAFRATDPTELRRASDPVGPNNLETLRCWLARPDVGLVVAAWGTSPRSQRLRLPPTYIEVMGMRSRHDLHCLGKTKDGDPRHPLYMKREVEPVLFRQAQQREETTTT